MTVTAELRWIVIVRATPTEGAVMKTLFTALALGAALAGTVCAYDWNKDAAASAEVVAADNGGDCDGCLVDQTDSTVPPPTLDALLAQRLLAGLRLY